MKKTIKKIAVNMRYQEGFREEGQLFEEIILFTPKEFLEEINEIEESNGDDLTEDLENDTDFIADLCTHPEGGSLNWAYDPSARYVHKVIISFEDGTEEVVYDFDEA